MKKIILFGAGSSGEKALKASKDKVLCFVDNDGKKHGTEKCGLPIISPGEIEEYSFDGIQIASIYESEIRNQLIELGYGEIIYSSSLDDSTSSINLAVDLDLSDKSDDKVVEDAHYSFNVALGYINKLKHFDTDIRDKSILELGPGVNFGTALVLLCFGAKRVVVSDRFLVSYDQVYHRKVYSELLQQIEKHPDVKKVNPLTDCIKNESHQTPGLGVLNSSLEEITKYYKNEFDVTLSNAVFEHLYSPLQAFRSLYRVTNYKGVGCHQVDFRDHRNFDKPLEFLLYDEHTFHSLMTDSSCEFGNRIRPFQMEAMFEEVGFRKLTFEPNLLVDKNYLNSFFKELRKTKYSNYCRLDKKELQEVSGNYMFVKE